MLAGLVETLRSNEDVDHRRAPRAVGRQRRSRAPVTSSLRSTRSPWQQQASAIAAKSGCTTKSVPSLRPSNRSSWMSRIEPSALSLSTTQVTGSSCSAATGRICMTIPNDPSPTNPTAGWSGCTTLATGSAAATKPIP